MLDQQGPPAEAVEKEGPGEQVPKERIRIKAKSFDTDERNEDVFTIQEEKDLESWRQLHRHQTLKRQPEHSNLAKQVVDQEIMAARISIPVFEEDVFQANMDATAFVNTALRRKSVEVSNSKLTEEEATEIDEAKSREFAEWTRKNRFPKVLESQEVPESRLMSMRWVLTWKPSDEHPQGRNAKNQNRGLGVSKSRGYGTEGGKCRGSERCSRFSDQPSTMQIWNALIPSPRSCRAMDTRCKTKKMYTRQHCSKSGVP